MNNEATPVQHDAVRKLPDGRVRGFNRYWTQRAIQLLRRVSGNPNIRQARNSWGSLDKNGHGAACANQVLIEFLDNVRNSQNPRGTLDKILPIPTGEIISMNDNQKLSFRAIADKLEQAAS